MITNISGVLTYTLLGPVEGRLYPVAGAVRGPGAVAHARCSFRNVPGTVQA
jgi:hypothetical protein